ncbi:uncharacterized protein N7479_000580 [Penicillium vulpinum]|uniref:uncharacterized protein n=1 Tax=Penicillium vulpinum TaxID=29845 RepID=UPI002548C60E|nr:uncharacterized protein N7479_000580 [Penicillium vulpinum]KAJ5970662.1 hypothetical protein N7479_000580 [Penicillium vulpinum]
MEMKMPDLVELAKALGSGIEWMRIALEMFAVETWMGSTAVTEAVKTMEAGDEAKKSNTNTTWHGK